MNGERPVYISLTQFKFPVTAIASIVHRLTGMAIFVGIAYLLWLLGVALGSPEGFAEASATLAMPLPKFVLWAVIVATLYHLVAGLKHLLLDLHVGDSFEAAAAGAWFVFATSAVLAVVTGWWLW